MNLAWGYPLRKNSPHTHLRDSAVAGWGCRAINARGTMDIVGNRTDTWGDMNALADLDLKTLREAVEQKLANSWDNYTDFGEIQLTPNISVLALKSYGYIHVTAYIRSAS